MVTLSSGAVERRVESVRASNLVFSNASFEFDNNSLMKTSLFAMKFLVSHRVRLTLRLSY